MWDDRPADREKIVHNDKLFTGVSTYCKRVKKGLNTREITIFEIQNDI